MVSGVSRRVAVLLAEIIADDAIDHEGSIHFAGVVKTSPPGRLPHLCGLMMPLVLSHLQLRMKIGQ